MGLSFDAPIINVRAEHPVMQASTIKMTSNTPTILAKVLQRFLTVSSLIICSFILIYLLYISFPYLSQLHLQSVYR